MQWNQNDAALPGRPLPAAPSGALSGGLLPATAGRSGLNPILTACAGAGSLRVPPATGRRLGV